MEFLLFSKLSFYRKKVNRRTSQRRCSLRGPLSFGFEKRKRSGSERWLDWLSHRFTRDLDIFLVWHLKKNVKRMLWALVWCCSTSIYLLNVHFVLIWLFFAPLAFFREPVGRREYLWHKQGARAQSEPLVLAFHYGFWLCSIEAVWLSRLLACRSRWCSSFANQMPRQSELMQWSQAFRLRREALANANSIFARFSRVWRITPRSKTRLITFLKTTVHLHQPQHRRLDDCSPFFAWWENLQFIFKSRQPAQNDWLVHTFYSHHQAEARSSRIASSEWLATYPWAVMKAIARDQMINAREIFSWNVRVEDPRWAGSGLACESSPWSWAISSFSVKTSIPIEFLFGNWNEEKLASSAVRSRRRIAASEISFFAWWWQKNEAKWVEKLVIWTFVGENKQNKKMRISSLERR